MRESLSANFPLMGSFFCFFSLLQTGGKQCNAMQVESHLHAKPTFRGRQAVFVRGVDADRAVILILEEPEVGVVGGGQAGHTGACADEARADVDGVGIAGLHMDRREWRERTRSGLVVPGGFGPRAAAGVVAGEEEAAAALDFKVGRLELRLEREDELERAVGVGALGGHVEAEDGPDVVGREHPVVLGAERLVRLRLGNLRDVVRELELAGGQVARAPAFAFRQGALAQHFAGVCGGEAGEEGGDSSKRLHLVLSLSCSERDQSW